ncbi:MAG: carbonic anhydrase [Verrucomicrobiota bacterium]|jgi:carbonic anhydrase
MRLFEAILDANHRAVAGDNSAGVHVADFAEELPVVALTCIDARLNKFFPGVMGLPEEYFIWLRNAGNIITSPVSSTMRSLALACAVKGGREIAIIGHTDCKIRHTTISALIDRLKAMGIDRQKLPENLTDYFGVFASEQQNVIRGVDFVRHSPLIGPKIPVHGLMVATDTGKLDWIVNGYEALDRPTAQPPPSLQMPAIGALAGELISRAGAELSGLKVPDSKIGEAATRVSQWMSEIKIAPVPAAPSPPQAPPSPPQPPSPAARPPHPIPIPPRIEPPQRPGGSRYRP